MHMPSANKLLTSIGVCSVGNEKWVWTFDQFVDLPYVWVTASDQIPTGPSGGVLQSNMTRVIQDNSTVAGKTEQVNSLGYYCETLLNVLQVHMTAKPSVCQEAGPMLLHVTLPFRTSAVTWHCLDRAHSASTDMHCRDVCHDPGTTYPVTFLLAEDAASSGTSPASGSTWHHIAV